MKGLTIFTMYLDILYSIHITLPCKISSFKDENLLQFSLSLVIYLVALTSRLKE